MDSYDLTQIASSLYAVLYVHRFMRCFFAPDDRRIGRRFSVLLYALYPCAAIAAYFLWNTPAVNLTAILLALFLVSLQYRAALPKRLTAVGLIYISLMLIETFCTLTTSYIGGSPFAESSYRDPFGVALAALISHAAAYTLYAHQNLRRSVPMPAGVWAAFGIVPAVSFLIVLFVEWEHQIGQWAALAIVIGLMLINGTMLLLFDRVTAVYQEKLQSVLLAQERESYLQQCRILQDSETSARAVRHEIRNQITLMQELCRQSPAVQMDGFLERLETALQEDTVYSRTGQLALDSILNLKLSQAHAQGIEVSCRSQMPQDVQIDSSDLMMILGNLIDNAIEAAVRAPEPFLSVALLYDRGMLFLTVENRYTGTLLRDGTRYRTTKSPRSEHGFGLSNVTKVLGRYHGTLELHHTEDVFTAQAVFYCRREAPSAMAHK